jgi:hypothetical protein
MDNEKPITTIRDLWRLALAIVGVIAVVQELRKPKDERTWHGEVAIFPYDFRMPTVGRFKDTYWNPNGPVVSGKVFGVGWAPNLGALVGLAAKLRSQEEPTTSSD